jgi:hypothetical protein
MIQIEARRTTSGACDGNAGEGKYFQMIEKARLNRKGERTEPV